MDARDLDNFFAARGVEPKCPICSESKWAPVDMDDGEMRITGRTSNDELIKGIAVFLIVCRQCAFVSAHAYDVISGRAEYGQ